MKKGCPSNISIQDQKLDCSGVLQEKRYGNPAITNFNRKPWDGIHLRGSSGRQHYTKSLVKVFAASFPNVTINWRFNQSADRNYHTTCPQARYQRYQMECLQQQTNYHQEHIDSHFTTKRSRGFKKNNIGQSKSNYEEQVYRVPLYNRFQGNF